MGDLHYIAYNGCCTTSNSVTWEFHNLGVFNTDMPHLMHNSAQEMDGCTPPSDLSSSIHSHYSTGYLQDALFEFSSKRRRLLLFSGDLNSSAYPNDHQSCWKENFGDIYADRFGYLNQLTEMDCITGNNVNSSGSVSESSSEKEIKKFMQETRTSKTEEITRVSKGPLDSSSSSQTKYSLKNKSSHPVSSTLRALDAPPSSAGGVEKKRKKIITRVVYPFAVVKPGGIEGDVTLNDINKRILMPPTRPVRHPVGDFACRPIASPHGRGLSGKAVVALTRIHTHGRGTITIIRTKT